MKLTLITSLTLASNTPFQDSRSGNDAETQTPKVFAATSGAIVNETIDSGSPFPAPSQAKQTTDPIGWESVFSELPQAVMVLNSQQKVLFTNAAHVDLVGDDVSKNELGIEAWFRLLCPDPEYATKTISSWHEHIWRNQLTRVFELNCKGTPRQIEFRSSLGSNGLVVLMLSDVTETQASGEALRQANFKFRSLFGNATGGVLVVDQGGKIQEVNKAFTEFSEMTSSDLVGKSFLGLLNKEDAEVLSKSEEASPDKIADRKRKVRFAFPDTDKDRPALVTPSYIFNENREIIFRIYQLKPRDQQLMGKLKELSAKAQALLSAVPDMFVLVDRNGVVKDWSPPAEVWEQDCLLNRDSIGKSTKDIWADFGNFIETNTEKVFADGLTIRHKLDTNEDGQHQSSITFAPFGDDLALILVEKPVSVQTDDTPSSQSNVGLIPSNNWQNQFFATSKAALVVTDVEGSLQEANPAANTLFGQTEAALLRANLFQLLSKAPGTNEEFDLDQLAELKSEKTWSNLLSVSSNGPRPITATVAPVLTKDDILDGFAVSIEPRQEVQLDPLSDQRELAHSQFRSQLQIATSLFSITPESNDPLTFNTWLMRLKVLAESMTTKNRVGVVHLMRDVADQVTTTLGNGRGLREIVISGSSALTIENESATAFALLIGEIMHLGVSSSGPDATGPSIYIDVEGYEGDIALTAKPGQDRALFTPDNKDNAKVIEILVEQLKGKISVGVGEDDDTQPPSIRLVFPAPQT